MIDRNSKLTIHKKNKLLLYKQILKPVWTYGIQLWGCSADSNIRIIQTFQNKILRDIIGAPWYCRDMDIHHDLKISTVNKEKITAARRRKQRLSNHLNHLANNLLRSENLTRRQKRTKPWA